MMAGCQQQLCASFLPEWSSRDGSGACAGCNRLKGCCIGRGAGQVLVRCCVMCWSRVLSIDTPEPSATA
jgi:hypothetical protein